MHSLTWERPLHVDRSIKWPSPKKGECPNLLHILEILTEAKIKIDSVFVDISTFRFRIFVLSEQTVCLVSSWRNRFNCSRWWASCSRIQQNDHPSHLAKNPKTLNSYFGNSQKLKPNPKQLQPCLNTNIRTFRNTLFKTPHLLWKTRKFFLVKKTIVAWAPPLRVGSVTQPTPCQIAKPKQI